VVFNQKLSCGYKASRFIITIKSALYCMPPVLISHLLQLYCATFHDWSLLSSPLQVFPMLTGYTERRYCTDPQTSTPLLLARLRLSTSFIDLPIAVSQPCLLIICQNVIIERCRTPPPPTSSPITDRLTAGESLQDSVSHGTFNALTFDKQRMTNQRSVSLHGAGFHLSASPARHKTALLGEW